MLPARSTRTGETLPGHRRFFTRVIYGQVHARIHTHIRYMLYMLVYVCVLIRSICCVSCGTLRI